MSLQVSEYQQAYCTNDFSITTANTTTKYQLSSDGYARTYRVHTPKNYDPSVRYPVVINFDGIGGSGSRMESYSGVDSLPVIAVYPDSIRGREGYTAWQGAPYSLKGNYDVQFVRDILDAIPSNYCTDSTNVFAIGMSNGGGFATILGCQMPDAFRAIASLSVAYYTSCAKKANAPSLLVMHSSSDQQVPFTGSSKRGLPAVTKWTKKEAAERQCQASSQNSLKNNDKGLQSSTYTVYDWQGCQNNTLLRLVVVKNQDHGWLQLPRGSETKLSGTTNYIWTFFQTVASR